MDAERDLIAFISSCDLLEAAFGADAAEDAVVEGAAWEAHMAALDALLHCHGNGASDHPVIAQDVLAAVERGDIAAAMRETSAATAQASHISYRLLSELLRRPASAS
jgi:hypothetical protein